jgi:hypothetical protein
MDMIDKPRNLSIIDFLIKKTAIRTILPESIIDQVVKDQYRQALKAFKRDDIYEIELSGFGYFRPSMKKCKSHIKKIEKLLCYEDTNNNFETKDSRLIKMEVLNKQLDIYRTKLLYYENRLERARGRSIQQISGSAMEEGNSTGEIPTLL